MNKVPLKALPNDVTIDSAGKKTWKIGTLSYTAGGIVVLFLWLLFGDFAWSMRERSVGPMSAWYLKSLGVPNLLFGLILTSFPALISLVLGPIISVKSDRHRSKWGRRIPFLMVVTPLAMFGMIGIALTPFIAQWLHSVLAADHSFGASVHALLDGTRLGAGVLSALENEMLVSVGCFAVFWAAFEFSTIVGLAVFGGLINDVVPKSLIGRFYGLFRAVSLLDGILFNYFLMGKVPDHFTLMLLIIGVFYGCAFLLMCLNVKEGQYPPPAQLESRGEGAGAQRIAVIRTYFRECFTNPYYLAVFLMLTVGMATFIPVNAFAIPYASSVGMDMEAYGRCLSISFAFSLCLSYFIGWLADLFHPLRMLVCGMMLYLLVAIWGMLFASDARNFEIAFILHALVSGCYFSGTASIGQRLYPQSKFAQFASASGIFFSICSMAIGPLVGTLVDLSGNYYNVTFMLGGIGALITLSLAMVVYPRFRALGGFRNYVAP